MINSDLLLHPDVQRVRYLHGLTDEASRELCSKPEASDPLQIHCARFAVHLVRGTPLPSNYAWEVLRKSIDEVSTDGILRPLENHLRAIALYAADFGVQEIDVLEWCRLDQGAADAAVYRFAHEAQGLSDSLIVELSENEDEEIRRFIAQVLAERPRPSLVPLVRRLMHDTDRRVRMSAARAAYRSKHPELIEELAATENYRGLGWIGDHRARKYIESLVKSDDLEDLELAVTQAHALGDRDLLEILWRHSDWHTRSNAIVVSVHRDYLDESKFIEILHGESEEHLAELAARWPPEHADQVSQLLDQVSQRTGCAPSAAELESATPEVLAQIQAFEAMVPAYGGACLRLIPESMAKQFMQQLIDSAEVKVLPFACDAISRRGLTNCYVQLAELCMHQDSGVSDAAADAAWTGRMRDCLYGLDTAVIEAGDDIGQRSYARRKVRYLVEAMLNPDHE